MARTNIHKYTCKRDSLGKLPCGHREPSPVLCEGLEGWGMGAKIRKGRTYVYLKLSHVIVWQKSTQYCEAIILQLKKNIFEIYERRV